MTYRRCWQLLWGAVALSILAPAVLFWSPGAVVKVLSFTTIFSAAVIAVLSSPTHRATRVSAAGCWRVVRVAFAIGLGAVAAIALAQLSFPAALLLVLAALGTAPGSVRYAAGQMRTRGWLATSAMDVVPEEPSPVVPSRPESDARRLEALTTAQLCDTWRRSLSTLCAARDVRTRLLAVHLREACLDELERRDPEGIRAWLGSGPSGSPDRFLGRRRTDPSGGQQQPPLEPPAAPDAA
jgi:hypothetical protein